MAASVRLSLAASVALVALVALVVLAVLAASPLLPGLQFFFVILRFKSVLQVRKTRKARKVVGNPLDSSVRGLGGARKLNCYQSRSGARRM